MPAQDTEWLVTDQRGSFAMGTREGFRTRKYHGLLMGIAGREESASLVDFEMECQDHLLWPHCYGSEGGPLVFPQLGGPQGVEMRYHSTEWGPQWQWILPEGKLKFEVRATAGGSTGVGGISLSWTWQSKTRKPAQFKLRGFWAMRNLHAVGGVESTWEAEEEAKNLFKVSAADQKTAYCLLEGDWSFTKDPKWYRNFHYSEEVARGYPSDENLFSHGSFAVELQPGQSVKWKLAYHAQDLLENREAPEKPAPKTFDFILNRPAGIIAGYPWFGEWGRDTFIALPGMVASVLKSEEELGYVETWSYELLHRWGQWINQSGMLPNVLGKEGEPQWNSADATLWWCHSLASLWMFSLCAPHPFMDLKGEFQSLLDQAITAIRTGAHQHLRENAEGLLEVTSPHATWMDACIGGEAVTPRLGVLPEINALWFQALCLQWFWQEGENFSEIESLGRKVLECKEADRPNGIFLHSLPLAPSFVLRDSARLEADLIEIAENFLTPVGLRTLKPGVPAFRSRYVGTQEERDLAYHQGPVWAWLGGHFEVARARFEPAAPHEASVERMFPSPLLEEMPIEGHIPEIFDAEPPYTSRGAPAQAWSLACLEEARARKRLKVDSKLHKALSTRISAKKINQDKAKASDGKPMDVQA